eukprot:scaffold288994_cov36-Tisochrysis_lutea.AAC.1
MGTVSDVGFSLFDFTSTVRAVTDWALPTIRILPACLPTASGRNRYNSSVCPRERASAIALAQRTLQSPALAPTSITMLRVPRGAAASAERKNDSGPGPPGRKSLGMRRAGQHEA